MNYCLRNAKERGSLNSSRAPNLTGVGSCTIPCIFPYWAGRHIGNMGSLKWESFNPLPSPRSPRANFRGNQARRTHNSTVMSPCFLFGNLPARNHEGVYRSLPSLKLSFLRIECGVFCKTVPFLQQSDALFSEVTTVYFVTELHEMTRCLIDLCSQMVGNINRNTSHCRQNLIFFPQFS